MNIIKPNFLLICPPKSGTSSVSQYLNEHPEIFFSHVKEPFYFTREIIKSVNPSDPMNEILHHYLHDSKEKYLNLFKSQKGEKAIGEGSVNYFYHYEHAIPKIKEELGDIKIIIVLRNPIDRLLSNYFYLEGSQNESLEDALKMEEARIADNYNSFWFLKKNSLYSDAVKSFTENFSYVKVSFFEDLVENPYNFMSELYGFLDVSPNYKPNIKVIHNQTKVSRFRFFSTLTFFKRKMNIKTNFNLKQKLPFFYSRPQMKNINNATISNLKIFFCNDIKELEKTLGLKIPKWK